MMEHDTLKKDKNGDELRRFYSIKKPKLSKEDGARLNRLLALHLRKAILETVFWERDSATDKIGLFEVMDTYDEAEGIIATLQLFGFIAEEEEEKP